MSDQTQNAPQVFRTADHTVDEVLAEVKAGKVTAEDALKMEEERGEEARSSLAEKLRAIINPPAAKAGGKVRVKVNPKRGAKGIAYYDPAQKATIGAKPVSVERTPFITRLLLTEQLIEA